TRELECTEEERNVSSEEQARQDAAQHYREVRRAPADEKEHTEENDAQPEPVEGSRERSQADLLNKDGGRAPGDSANDDGSETRRSTLGPSLASHRPRSPLIV